MGVSSGRDVASGKTAPLATSSPVGWPTGLVRRRVVAVSSRAVAEAAAMGPCETLSVVVVGLVVCRLFSFVEGTDTAPSCSLPSLGRSPSFAGVKSPFQHVSPSSFSCGDAEGVRLGSGRVRLDRVVHGGSFSMGSVGFVLGRSSTTRMGVGSGGGLDASGAPCGRGSFGDVVEGERVAWQGSMAVRSSSHGWGRRSWLPVSFPFSASHPHDEDETDAICGNSMATGLAGVGGTVAAVAFEKEKCEPDDGGGKKRGEDEDGEGGGGEGGEGRCGGICLAPSPDVRCRTNGKVGGEGNAFEMVVVVVRVDRDTKEDVGGE